MDSDDKPKLESLKPETIEEIIPIYDNCLMPAELNDDFKLDNASKQNSKSVDEFIPYANTDLQMDQTNATKRLTHSKSLKLNKANRSCKQDEGLTSNPSEKTNSNEDYKKVADLIKGINNKISTELAIKNKTR